MNTKNLSSHVSKDATHKSPSNKQQRQRRRRRRPPSSSLIHSEFKLSLSSSSSSCSFSLKQRLCFLIIPSSFLATLETLDGDVLEAEATERGCVDLNHFANRGGEEVVVKKIREERILLPH